MWFIALLAFVVLSSFEVLDPYSYLLFFYAIPANAIVLLSLRSAWHDFRWNMALISIIMWGSLLSLFVTLHVTLDSGCGSSSCWESPVRLPFSCGSGCSAREKSRKEKKTMDKQQLRKAIREKKRAMTPEEIERRSEILARLFLETPGIPSGPHAVRIPAL